jgi:hypothetical protein
LRQDGQLTRQSTRERLERTAKEIGRDLDSEFRRWEETVRLASREGTFDVDSFPETVQQAFEQPGGGVFLSVSAEGFETFPRASLLYVPMKTAAPRTLEIASQPPVLFAEAESLEIKRKDYRRAIFAYRSLLDSADAELRPLLLQRLARTLRKAGRLDEAAGAYRDLQRMDTVWLGGLPSDLIARSELCSLAAERGDVAELKAASLAFYRDLTGGKWFLDRPRYLYYSDSCRSWCLEVQVDVDEFDRLRTIEERKFALSRAAEEMLNEPRRILSGENESHLAFWNADPFAAVVFSEAFLGLNWWPRVLSSQGEDLDAALYSPDGKVLFGSPPSEAPPFAVKHDVRLDDMPWLLQI